MMSTSTDVRHERWDKAHGRMASKPPSEGRDYIQHALTLLDFLKPISEAHPIAKVVIGCFEQLVLYEKDRRESDSRVASVILAQTGMMRVLLDIEDLTARSGDPSALRSMADLRQHLEEVKQDISDCHNSIDTYYREHRLVKLCKVKEWKERMIGYVETFDKHRVLLHQTMSLQVASDVTDLVSMMKLVLNRLYLPREPWEHDVTAKIQARNDPNWIDDPDAIQSLALATGDPSNLMAQPSSLTMSGKIGAQLTTLNLKEELQLSLDTLCSRNTELFDLKLKLHTEKLEKAISHSARLVITSLSGPYERLEHEDLRALWKEMNWIFCVETKVFGIALFEYYLDLYSHSKQSSVTAQDTSFWVPKLSPFYGYDSGAVQHPLAWTLQYLFTFADKIAHVIDSDDSGLIRISEANAFTAQIPDGWSLPEWCAFLVEGQFHENSIYRKRLTHLFFTILEVQAKILPNNRYASAEVISMCSRILHPLILEPRGRERHVRIAGELHELVRNKILKQDERFRSRLKSIKWTIPDVSAVEALSDSLPLETYIFPLTMVLMEFMMDVHHLCLSKEIDFKEWLVPHNNFLSLRTIAFEHLKRLRKQFDDDGNKSMVSDVQTYHQRMWAMFSDTSDEERALGEKDISNIIESDAEPIMQSDYDEFYADQAFLDEFPLPQPTGSLMSLRYSSWDDFKKGKVPADIPLEQPMTWNPIDDTINETKFRDAFKILPVAGWNCDRCDEVFDTPTRSFRCLNCFNFDLCKSCYELEPSKHAEFGHEFGHMMCLECWWPHPFRWAWIKFRAEAIKDSIQEKVSLNRSRYYYSLYGSLEDAYVGLPVYDELSLPLGSCARCAAEILNSSPRFYVCAEYSCAKEAVFLCEECAWTNEFPEGTGHFWWHSMLTIDSRTAPQSPRAYSISPTQSPPPPPPADLIPVAASPIDDPIHGAEPAGPDSSALIDATSAPETPAANLELAGLTEDSKDQETDKNVDPESNAQFRASMTQRMDTMEAKLVNVEEKLDAMSAQLQRLVDVLLVPRS